MVTKNDRKAQLEFPYPDDDFLDDDLPKGVLSPSGISSYKTCPRRFMYSYIDGIIQPPAGVMVKGTAIHRGAEVVHKHTIETGKPMGLEEARQEVSDTFDDEKDDVEDWGEEGDIKKDAGMVKDEAVNNFTVYYRNAVPLIQPVAAEEPFAIRVGTVPVRGVIDLIDKVKDDFVLTEDPDAPETMIEVVSDLKTTKRMWIPQMLAQSEQLTFYALAKQTSNVRVDFLLDQKSGVKYVPKRSVRDANQKRLLVEDVEEVAHLIKQGVFPRCSPTAWNCTPKFCGYYDRCRGPK